MLRSRSSSQPSFWLLPALSWCFLPSSPSSDGLQVLSRAVCPPVTHCWPEPVLEQSPSGGSSNLQWSALALPGQAPVGCELLRHPSR